MKRIILAVILICVTGVSQARWATYEDASVEVLSNDVEIKVRKDGTYDSINEVQIKILNELGRESYATFPLYYMRDNSELEILTAETINDGKATQLDPSSIEDKPLASAIQGFDQKHQVLLAFPEVRVGSIIRLKYRLNQLKTDLPGFYDGFFDAGGRYTKTANLHIVSELPLYFEYNNPSKYFTIENSREGKKYVIDVKLNKPIFVNVIDEHQSNINPNLYPWIYVVSNQDHHAINKKIADPFLKVMQEPLPALYQEIYEQAAELDNPKDQMDLVMSQINASVQYMGDWQTANGRLVPQNLARVAQRRLGDCKDFSTGTAVILNKLGIKANVALVNRNAGIYYDDMVTLPGLSKYNHAIVKATVGKDVYWLDPTNFFSTTLILPDIADRPALVLSEKPKEEHIPQSKPTDNVIKSVRNIDLHNPELGEVKGQFSLLGLAAIEYTGAMLQVSRNTIEVDILEKVGNLDYMTKYSVDMPELKSRIVRNLDFKYIFDEKDYVSQSNAGYVVPVSAGSLAAGFIFNPDHVSDVYLGAPSSGTRSYTFDNVNPVGKLDMNSSVSSKWLDVKRTVTYGKDSVTVEYDYSVKVSWIPRDEINSPEYKKLSDKLSKDFSGGISIIFTN